MPFIDMNQTWVYMCPPSWTPLSPPSPSHPSGSSQCTSPERTVSCIEPGLVICFTYDDIHDSMLFSQIIPPSLSPTEFEFHSFTSGWPVSPGPLIKEIVFSPLYILASFVKDKVSIGAWIHLWAFCFVPLIYISVFVSVPYCLDDCSFVVEPEVRQVDSPSSILHSQDSFGYSRFFVFPYKLWNYLF